MVNRVTAMSFIMTSSPQADQARGVIPQANGALRRSLWIVEGVVTLQHGTDVGIRIRTDIAGAAVHVPG